MVKYRRQGMRVGLEVSKRLGCDPPVFSGLQPLELLPEEAWHSSCGGTAFGIPSDDDSLTAPDPPPEQPIASVPSEKVDRRASQQKKSWQRKHASAEVRFFELAYHIL